MSAPGDMCEPLPPAVMAAAGYRRLACRDVPKDEACAGCGFPGLDDPDPYAGGPAPVEGPTGRFYCGWACARSAERTRRYRARENSR